MPALTPRRRSHGTGCLHVQTRADGRQLWYGRWYAGSRRLNRRIGLKRKRGTSRGLTKLEAEAELRRMMLRDRPPQIGDEITFATAAELMLRELEELGRKPTTLGNYRQILDYRLLPRFGETPIGRVKRSAIDVAEKPFGAIDKAIVLTAAMRAGCARASFWRSAGATSTGRRSGYACAATTCADTGKRRSRAAANAR